MLLSRRAQLQLSTLCIVLTVAFYGFIFLQSRLQSQFHYDKVDLNGAASSHPTHDLTQVLHPYEHIHRSPRSTHLTFNITSGYHYPDGVKKKVFLINGQFPGPTIETRSGDKLQVEVQNFLENGEDIAMHWHGLTMRGANSMDGTVGLTQCAISKGQSFTYSFTIEDAQAGTYWYHAHSEVHRADGLYGAFIVHNPVQSAKHTETKAQDYDEELLLMIGDWYHRPAQEILDYYMDWNNYGNEPAPDSLLINGIGAFNCSMAVPARPVECKDVAIPTLQLSGKRSLLRIINTGALTGFTLSMPSHQMVVLQADGGNAVKETSPAKSIGILYPGERIDVLVKPESSAKASTPQMTIALDPENMKFPNLALTRIQDFPISSPHTHSRESDIRPVSIEPTRPASTAPHFNLLNLTGATSSPEEMPTAQVLPQTFLLYTKIEILAEFHNIPKGFINRTSWDPYPSPATTSPLLSQARTSWPSSRYIPRVSASSSSSPSGSDGTKANDSWFDIVVNNMDDKSHPFHLHGNAFYVLSTHEARFGSYDAYNPFDTATPPAGGPMNTKDPVKKDTVIVPRMGYVVLRVKADNEGLWFFHCHVLWHEAVGMAMAFQVGGSEESAWAGEAEGRLAGELCARGSA